MNANQIKDFEAAWIADGYPGPDFPPVTVPPDPNDQVGIIDGNTSGIVIDEIDTRYNPGDEILAAVYSGHRPEHPGLRVHRRDHGDDQHQPEPRQRDHDERDEERLVHRRRRRRSAFPDWGDRRPPVGDDPRAAWPSRPVR